MLNDRRHMKQKCPTPLYYSNPYTARYDMECTIQLILFSTIRYVSNTYESTTIDLF